MNNPFTEEQLAAYHRDGFLLIRNFVTKPEIERLHAIAIGDDTMSRHAYEVRDKGGLKSKLTVWYTPGNDAYGLLTRSERMVHAANQLLDGDAPVCHFHSKLMQKEPNVGGAWEWHQDYGYWYRNEFLYPDQMLSVMLAITHANKENGCLQIIKGSHKIGRIEHGFAGQQVGASQHYVDLALKHMELVYVEVEPGDAFFFHSNLLHRSDANLSPNSRWSLISCYNRQSNAPTNEKSTACTVPLVTVPNDAFMTEATEGLSDDAGFFEKVYEVQ